MIGVYVRVHEDRVPMENHERIVLVVPVPPPTNNRFRSVMRRSGTGKRYYGVGLSAKCATYQRFIRQLCVARRIVPLAKDVGMIVRWYRDRKSGDLPDRWKDLCDALQSVQKDKKTKRFFDTGIGAYHDDAQIADFRVIRYDVDPKNPRCELEIWSMEDQCK